MKKFMIAMASVLALAGVAQAEGTDPNAAAQLAGIKRMAGDWHGKGTMKDGGKSFPIAGSMNCVETSGGAGVRCETKFTGVPGMPSYEETDLFGYDPGDGLVHWFSVTNAGETHDHKGGFSGNVLSVTHVGPQTGQLFAECITMTWKDPKTLHVEARVFVGSTRGPVFDFTVTR